MVSVSLLQLLDDVVGTPEVKLNLEALRKLLKIMLGHLSRLGLQDVVPLSEENQPAGSHLGLQKEDRAKTEAHSTGQQPQEPGEQLSGKDLLQGTRSGPPVTSLAADMEKTKDKESGISEATARSKDPHGEVAEMKATALSKDPHGEVAEMKATALSKDPREEVAEMKATALSKEPHGEVAEMKATALSKDPHGEVAEMKATALSKDPHEEVAEMKATLSHTGEEIQRIKEALAQAMDLSKDLRKEVNEMKAMQSHTSEDIKMIQEALCQHVNLQDAADQPLAFHDQSSPAKPHTSDMDTLEQWPDTQRTTPGIQTGAPSAKSSTTETQPGSQAGHPTVESITRDLTELQGQVFSLQGLASDLQGEKEKIRQLEDGLQKLHVADDRDQISLLGSALQEIKQDQNELREEQKITEATLKQLVTDKQLQEQLDILRARVESMWQKQTEAESRDHSSDSEVLVKKLLHHYEKLQKQVDTLVPQQVQRSFPQKSQDEELLKSIQATIVQVEGDFEQLSYVTRSLREEHHQQQKDIEALFRSLESLEKKADKEDLLLLKEDKAAMSSKVNCTQFEVSMELLEKRIQDILKQMLAQEQLWQEVQEQLRDTLDSKLDRLDLEPFRKRLETYERAIKLLKNKLSMIVDDAAGIKKQLPVPYKCLSCDRNVNMQVPGPHIDTLPFYPPMPISHSAHPTMITTKEQAQQHGYRKLANGSFNLKSQTCSGQNVSNAQLKDKLWLFKKVYNLIDQGQEQRPEVIEREKDKPGPTALLEEHQPPSDSSN